MFSAASLVPAVRALVGGGLVTPMLRHSYSHKGFRTSAALAPAPCSSKNHGRVPGGTAVAAEPSGNNHGTAYETAYAAHEAALDRAGDEEEVAATRQGENGLNQEDEESRRREAHNARQARVFSGATTAWFAASGEALPTAVQWNLRQIVHYAGQASRPESGAWRVLDVGCGTGVLVERYGFTSTVVGVDVSPDMIKKCRARFVDGGKKALEVAQTCPQRVAFWTGDIVDFPQVWREAEAQQEAIKTKQASSSSSEQTEEEEEAEEAAQEEEEEEDKAREQEQVPIPKVSFPANVDPGQPFDCAVFNACFGNVFDQREALRAAAEVVRPGGAVIVAHPLGERFLNALRAKDPTVVPHSLPDSFDALRELTRPKPTFLRARRLQQERHFYLAVYERTPHAMLETPLLLRGPVARGYGRGGKKLGFPTANLPENLFGDALQNVTPGVYTCWAHVDGVTDVVVPAVANVGYSPTFAGAENPVKIVEAHLIFERKNNRGRSTSSQEDSANNTTDDDAPTDFYGKTMTLLLTAFQRPERKFPSLGHLETQIRNDVRIAYYANTRDDRDLERLRSHPRLNSTNAQDRVLAEWLDVTAHLRDTPRVGFEEDVFEEEEEEEEEPALSSSR